MWPAGVLWRASRGKDDGTATSDSNLPSMRLRSFPESMHSCHWQRTLALRFRQWHVGLQVREGVRTEAEALALGRQVAACPGLHLRGVMTHHGRLDVFQPIVKAFKDTFGQASGL